jgi:hypothetical protein
MKLLAALLASMLTLALAVVASASETGAAPPTRTFKLPGGSVTCVLSGGGAGQNAVICTAKLEPGARKFPRRPCPDAGDSGGAILLGLKGKPKGVCLSENPFQPPIRTLAYGKRISLGGISCAAISKAIGLRCENASATGFQLSAAKGWKGVATTEG